MNASIPAICGEAAPGGEILLKTGEMGFLNFLEMVSDRLNILVNASGLEVGSKTVPNTSPLSLYRKDSDSVGGSALLSTIKATRYLF